MDEPKPMTELTRIRQERNLSQQGLADASGVNKATINQIERGRRSPNVETLEKITAALGVELGDLFPKGQASLLDFVSERRKSKLPETADLLLRFGEMLLRTWESELPARARADDDEWLANIVVLWRTFGLINYGVLDELGAEGLQDKQGWLARYMDVNAAVHRINAAIREHSTTGEAQDEEAAVLLEPLVAA
jgi:transcriptional regulator with XRE-family HTH domain